jgi:hypothetical protein
VFSFVQDEFFWLVAYYTFTDMPTLFLCFSVGTVFCGFCGALLAYLFYVNFFVGLSVCIAVIFACSILVYKNILQITCDDDEMATIMMAMIKCICLFL